MGCVENALAIGRLTEFLETNGYLPIDVPTLQPTDPFLEMSGESVRRSLLVLQNITGVETCLRPEFTIPVCREYIRNNEVSLRNYSYSGSTFRLVRAEPRESIQLGIESIGREDQTAADAEIVDLARRGLQLLAVDSCVIKLSDMRLLRAFLSALTISTLGQRRIIRAIASGRPLGDLMERNREGTSGYDGLLAVIRGKRPEDVQSLIDDILSISSISQVGGRTTSEIAERLLDKAAIDPDGMASVDERNLGIIEKYCTIETSPDQALDQVAELAFENEFLSPELSQALHHFRERLGFMAARDIDLSKMTFVARFARNLDYYTGLIFEIRQQDSQNALVGGGRYNDLLHRLGHAAEVPAVGCTFFVGDAGFSITSGERGSL